MLPTILCDPDIQSLPVIHGSKHNEHVCITTAQDRKQYSGYSKNRKKLNVPKPEYK